MCGRQIKIIKTADIFHVYNLEDVMYTSHKFHVWTVVHHITALRERHQLCVIGILL